MRKFLLALCLVLFASLSYAGSNPYVLGSVPLDCGDTFTASNGSAPNAVKWTEADAAYMDIQSNKLHFTADQAAIAVGTITSNYYFRITDDFDIQIDFVVTTLEEPDAGVQYCPRLKIKNGDGSVYCEIMRTHSDVPINGYAVNGSATVYAAVADVDATGSLRIYKSGNTIYGCMYDGGWKWNGGACFEFTEVGTDFDYIYVVIGWNSPATTAAAENTGDVDDYKVNEGKCYY